jgi:hypothetical protein
MGYKKNWLKSAVKRPSSSSRKKQARGFAKTSSTKLRQINLEKALNKIRGGK